MLKNQGDVYGTIALFISRVKHATAFHQFHGLKSNRRLDFAAQLSHDAFQNKVCFTSFKY